MNMFMQSVDRGTKLVIVGHGCHDSCLVHSFFSSQLTTTELPRTLAPIHPTVRLVFLRRKEGMMSLH